jgi:hypothetical protein
MNEQEKLDNLQKLLQERNINISDFSRARIKIFNGDFDNFVENYDTLESEIDSAITPYNFEDEVMAYAHSLESILRKDSSFFKDNSKNVITDLTSRIQGLATKYMPIYMYNQLLTQKKQIEEEIVDMTKSYVYLSNDNESSIEARNNTFFDLIREELGKREELKGKIAEIDSKTPAHESYISNFPTEERTQSLLEDTLLINSIIFRMNLSEDTKNAVAALQSSLKNKFSSMKTNKAKAKLDLDALCADYGISNLEVRPPHLIINNDTKTVEIEETPKTDEVKKPMGYEFYEGKHHQTETSKNAEDLYKEKISKLQNPEPEFPELIARIKEMKEKGKDAAIYMGVKERQNRAFGLEEMTDLYSNEHNFKLGDKLVFNGFIPGKYVNNSDYRKLTPGEIYTFAGYKFKDGTFNKYMMVAEIPNFAFDKYSFDAYVLNNNLEKQSSL